MTLCTRCTFGVCSLPHRRRSAKPCRRAGFLRESRREPRCQSSAPCSPTHRPPRGCGLWSTGLPGSRELAVVKPQERSHGRTQSRQVGAMPHAMARAVEVGQRRWCKPIPAHRGFSRPDAAPRSRARDRPCATPACTLQDGVVDRCGLRTIRPSHAGNVGMTQRVGIAADHGGFVIKTELVRSLRA